MLVSLEELDLQVRRVFWSAKMLSLRLCFVYLPEPWMIQATPSAPSLFKFAAIAKVSVCPCGTDDAQLNSYSMWLSR